MTGRGFRLLIILIALIISNGFAADSYAQRKNITSQEKGVLAFYRITGLKPNITQWITTSKDYKAMPQNLAADYLEQEKLRLQWGLGTFNPQEDYLEVNTKILTSIIEKDGKSYLASHFPDRSALNPPYFPHNIADIWVALVVKDLKDFMVLELDEEQQERIGGYLTKDKKEHELNIKIVSRVISADKDPLLIDGVQQFMMLGEVAYISFSFPDFHQSQDKLLWEHYEEWYMDESKQDLMKILESRFQTE